MTRIGAISDKYSKGHNLLKLLMQIGKKDSRLSTSTFVLVCFLVGSPLFVSILRLMFGPFWIIQGSSYIEEASGCKK